MLDCSCKRRASKVNQLDASALVCECNIQCTHARTQKKTRQLQRQEARSLTYFVPHSQQRSSFRRPCLHSEYQNGPCGLEHQYRRLLSGTSLAKCRWHAAKLNLRTGPGSSFGLINVVYSPYTTSYSASLGPALFMMNTF